MLKPGRNSYLGLMMSLLLIFTSAGFGQTAVLAAESGEPPVKVVNENESLYCFPEHSMLQSMTPDGKYLVVNYDKPYRSANIFLLRTDTKAITQLTEGDTLRSGGFISATGDYVFYYEMQQMAESGTVTEAVLKAYKVSDETTITISGPEEKAAPYIKPAISPLGDQVAYVDQASHAIKLYKLSDGTRSTVGNIHGSQPIYSLSTEAGDDHFFEPLRFSPDGKALYSYFNIDSKGVLAKWSEGKSESIYTSPSPSHRSIKDVSDDGKYLLLVDDTIDLFDTDRKEIVQHIPVSHSSLDPFAIFLDNRFIHFGDNHLYDLETDQIYALPEPGMYAKDGKTTVVIEPYTENGRVYNQWTVNSYQTQVQTDYVVHAPNDVIIDSVTPNAVYLSWGTIEDATGYILYRNSEPIAELELATYLDTGLPPSTALTYTVRAVRDGVYSPLSRPVIAMTAAIILSAPANFKANEVGYDQVSLSWDTVMDAEGYTLYRNGDEIWSGQETAFVDMKVASEETYVYTVAAVNQGTAGPTSELIITTLKAPLQPSKPELPEDKELAFRAELINETTVRLSWNPVDKATSYQIARNGERLVELSDTIYTDTALTPNMTYKYELIAVNEYGQSSPAYVEISIPALEQGPDTVENLRAVQVYYNGAVLQWDAAKGAETYTLLRDGHSVFTGEATLYKDTELAPGTQYEYVVVANNQNGTSTSDELVITTGSTLSVIETTTPIMKEKSIAFSITGNLADEYHIERAHLQWIYRSNGDGSFQLTRSNLKTGEKTDYGDVLLVKGGLSFKESGVQSGQVYTYLLTSFVRHDDGIWEPVGKAEVTVQVPMDYPETEGPLPGDNGNGQVDPGEGEGGGSGTEGGSESGEGNGGVNPGDGSGGAGPDPGAGSGPGAGGGSGPGTGSGPEPGEGSGSGPGPGEGNGGENPGSGSGGAGPGAGPGVGPSVPGAGPIIPGGNGAGGSTSEEGAHQTENEPKPGEASAIKNQTGPIRLLTSDGQTVAVDWSWILKNMREKNTSATYSVPSDINSSWAREDILSLMKRGVITGYTEGTFQAERAVSRAEFISLLVRTLQLGEYRADAAFADSNTSAWYYNYVNVAHKLGLADGVGDSRFAPDRSITRQEVATILGRFLVEAAIVRPVNATSTTAILQGFPDYGEVSVFARSYQALMVKEGLMTGRNNNMLVPKGTTTRGETAAILNRLLVFLTRLD